MSRWSKGVARVTLVCFDIDSTVSKFSMANRVGVVILPYLWFVMYVNLPITGRGLLGTPVCLLIQHRGSPLCFGFSLHPTAVGI